MEKTKETTPYYEMYTRAGDAAVHSATMKVVKKINGKMKVSKDEILDMVKKALEKVSEKHGEVYDTEPEYHVSVRVNEALEKNGYGFQVSRYEW